MSDNRFSEYQRDQQPPQGGEGLIQPNHGGEEVPVQMDSPSKSTYDLNVQNAKQLKVVTGVLKVLILTLLILSGLGILSLIFKINLTPGKNTLFSHFWPRIVKTIIGRITRTCKVEPAAIDDVTKFNSTVKTTTINVPQNAEWNRQNWLAGKQFRPLKHFEFSNFLNTIWPLNYPKSMF